MKKAVAVLAIWGIAGVFAYVVGHALYFTLMQSAALWLSCFLFASWLLGEAGSEAVDAVNHPITGVVLTALFIGLLHFWFWGMAERRVISLMITALPAVPYAVMTLIGLVWKG